MKFKNRPKIALLVETSRSYGRELLRGVNAFARTRSNWSLMHQEMTIDVTMPAWINSASIDGIIARVDENTIDALRALQIPLVDVRCHKQLPDIPQVDTDDRVVAEMAFEHLWDRGFRRFAFCGFQFAKYSETRLRYFRMRVAESGCLLSVHASSSGRGLPLTRIEEPGMDDIDQMSAWLQSLIPPTGIFACNDIRGQQVLDVCRSINLNVPDDIAVVSVDDDDVICPLTDPPLSSVRPNAQRIGYRAAEILHDMMNGVPPAKSIELVPPTEVVQRLSTQVVAVEDRELANVCRFIREHACDGINVQDVAEVTSLSRRQLERRFRSALNRTLHDEITTTQIGKVKQLLRETTMTLEMITPLAGYSHKERLCAVFKRETGGTPGDYRRREKIL